MSIKYQDIRNTDAQYWTEIKNLEKQNDYQGLVDYLTANYDNLLVRGLFAKNINDLTELLVATQNMSDPIFKDDLIKLSKTAPSPTIATNAVWFEWTD